MAALFDLAVRRPGGGIGHHGQILVVAVVLFLPAPSRPVTPGNPRGLLRGDERLVLVVAVQVESPTGFNSAAALRGGSIAHLPEVVSREGYSEIFVIGQMNLNCHGGDSECSLA